MYKNRKDLNKRELERIRQLQDEIKQLTKGRRSNLWKSQKSDVYYTPPHLVKALVEKWGPFSLDAAACAESHHAPKYFTEDDDGLAQSWGPGTVFCNPPFSLLKEFLQKAGDEVEFGETDRVVFLCPNKSQRAFWRKYVSERAAEVYTVDGPVGFGEPTSQGIKWHPNAHFSLVVIIFQKGKRPGEKYTTHTLFLDPKSVSNTAAHFDIQTSLPSYVARGGTSKWSVSRSDNLAWLKSLAPGSVQTFILDPPYNCNFKYDTYKDDLPVDVYIERELERLRFAYEALGEGGSIFYLNYPDNASRIFGAAEKFMSPVRQISWVYNTQCRSYPFNRAHRTWLWFSKGKAVINPNTLQGEYISVNDARVQEKMADGCKPQHTDWYQTPQVNNFNKERRNFHPCQYPQMFADEFIKATTKPGDRVADYYLGSGTTAIAALEQGRNFVGCDMDEKYVRETRAVLTQRFGSGEFVSTPGLISSFIKPSDPVTPDQSSDSKPSSQVATEAGEIKGLMDVDRLLAPLAIQSTPLVSKFYRKVGLSAAVGQFGTFKSGMFADLLWAGATGSLWLEEIPVAKCVALGFDLEMETDEVQERYQAIYQARIKMGKPKDLHIVSGQKFDLTDPQSAAKMKAIVATIRPGLVVIDPFYKLAKISESNNRQIADVLAILEGWAEEFQCHIIVVHHIGKNVKGGARGGSLLEDEARTVLNLFRGKDNISQVYVKKTRGFRWEQKDRTFNITVLDGRVFKTDKPFVPDVAEPVAAVTEKPKVSVLKRALAREVVLGVLAGGKEVGRPAIKDVCRSKGVSDHIMADTLAILVDEKVILKREAHPGGRAGKKDYYRMNTKKKKGK